MPRCVGQAVAAERRRPRIDMDAHSGGVMGYSIPFFDACLRRLRSAHALVWRPSVQVGQPRVCKVGPRSWPGTFRFDASSRTAPRNWFSTFPQGAWFERMSRSSGRCQGRIDGGTLFTKRG